jgi:nucleoside-diphosphate-sugar epimerase
MPKGAVCVTGAAGDIGVALVGRLMEEGYAVSAWDSAPGRLPAIAGGRRRSTGRNLSSTSTKIRGTGISPSI